MSRKSKSPEPILSPAEFSAARIAQLQQQLDKALNADMEFHRIKDLADAEFNQRMEAECTKLRERMCQERKADWELRAVTQTNFRNTIARLRHELDAERRFLTILANPLNPDVDCGEQTRRRGSY